MTVTIEWRRIELTFEGEYTPGERQVMYYPDGSGYPGTGPEFEWEKVYFNGCDITDLAIEMDEYFIEWEEKILEKI